MRPRALCGKLNEVLEDGYAEGAFLAFQPHLLSGAAKRQILGPAVVPGMISPGGVSLPDFIEILDRNSYSAVFSDGAIVIIQCIFRNDDIDTHRYSYIPCPIDRSLVQACPEQESLADWLRELTSSSGTESFRSLGTYRFDCVRSPPANSIDPHPVSHLTFGSPDCRIPVRGPMSPGSFFCFLFENFYRSFRDFWEPLAPHLECQGTDQTLTPEEQRLHHLQRLP